MGGCCVGNCCVFDCCIGDLPCFLDFGCSDKGCSDCSNHPDIRNSGSANENSTAQEMFKLQNALAEFKEDTQKRSDKLENAIIKESREYLDSFLDDMRRYNKIKYGKKKLNINLSHIERENRKTEDKIHGFIVKRVSERISLGNDECKEILKMDAGDAKQQKMDEFYRKVLKEAIIELSEELRTNMETQTDNVCERIQQRIDNIVDVCDVKTKDFEQIQKVKESDEGKLEQEQLRLSHFVALCEYGLEQLN